MVRSILIVSAALLLTGCASTDMFPPSKGYVDQRIGDVNDKMEQNWENAYDAGVQAQADGAETGDAAWASVKAGYEASRKELPVRSDWLTELWLALAGIGTLAYRYLVGRWPVLGGVLEASMGKAPAQKKKAASARKRAA